MNFVENLASEKTPSTSQAVQTTLGDLLNSMEPELMTQSCFKTQVINPSMLLETGAFYQAWFIHAVSFVSL